MKQPYFSIVIPTKNRPDYLRDSILSALLQDFNDYEVIVSDNFNDDRTLQVADDFFQNKTFKYFRTSEPMNMLNHWEWATKKATGKYVILLPDRKLLMQGALKKLYSFLHLTHHDNLNCISFGVKAYNDIENKWAWNAELAKTRKFLSEEMLNNFLNENYFEALSLDTYFPKTLNGCFKNEFAQGIRSRFGNYFNTDHVTTPDYSSLFINLSLNDEVCFLGEYIVMAQGEH